MASKRIQIISPHPDDVDIFLGGTFLKHLDQDAQIQIIMMTRGEKGSLWKRSQGKKLAIIREAEANKRIKNLKNINIIWMPFKDKEIPSHTNSEEFDVLQQTIKDFSSDIIYLPESSKARSFYSHQDHIRTGAIIEKIALGLDKKILLRYYHSRLSNTFIDVSPYFINSQRSLLVYKSQCKITRFWCPPPIYNFIIFRYFLSHWLGKKISCKFAEGFRETWNFQI